MRKIWSFSFYFLYYAGVAAMMPYMVLYYQYRGLSGAQIGLITGIIPLITLVSVPFWTGLADTTGRHRLVMSLAMLVGISAMAIFPLVDTFVLIFGAAVVLQIFFSPTGAFADSATMQMLGERKELYGRVRLGGTIGFGIVATFAGILVENQGLKMAFWGGAVWFFLAFLTTQKFTYAKVAKSDVSRLKGLQVLAKNPHWLIFLLLAFTGGVAFTATNTYFFPFMKELGASEGLMGVALTVGTLAEIPVMLFVNRLIVRFKPYGTLVIAIIFTGLRLLLFAIAMTPTFVIFVQIINAFTFPIMWVAGVAYADAYAPHGLRTTAQGLFGVMVSGIGAATGGFIGGLLLANLGGRGLYMIFGIFVFVVLLLATLIRVKLPPEEAPATNQLNAERAESAEI
jgi:PPP family 3-phenylpropionic acid transporter